MLPWRRFHLSYFITPRFSPACTGSVAVAALPVHDINNYVNELNKHFSEKTFNKQMHCFKKINVYDHDVLNVFKRFKRHI